MLHSFADGCHSITPTCARNVDLSWYDKHIALCSTNCLEKWYNTHTHFRLLSCCNNVIAFIFMEKMKHQLLWFWLVPPLFASSSPLLAFHHFEPIWIQFKESNQTAVQDYQRPKWWSKLRCAFDLNWINEHNCENMYITKNLAWHHSFAQIVVEKHKFAAQ